MNIKNDAVRVLLGGLLHDIGKFVQRAYWSENGTEKMKSHWEYGAEFLREIGLDEIAVFAKHHHKEMLKNIKEFDERTKNLIYIVYMADNLSSKERGKSNFTKFGMPLASVFDSITEVKEGIDVNVKNSYPLIELSPKKFFRPIPRSAGMSIRAKDYRSLYERFRKDIGIFLEKKDVDKLLILLERYTSFIPAIMTENNDISLYDHLRTTAAIALCLYYYHEKELDSDIKDRILDESEEKFILIGGDVSGIQRFIYNISAKGALKYLRARSTFLEFLAEDVVEEILKELKLERTNVIYSGGGHFYILAPNTKEVKEKLGKIKSEINRWLYDKFWGDLYLAMSWIELSGESLKDLKKNEHSIWTLITQKLSEEKNRKFREIFLDEPSNYTKLFERSYEKNTGLCPVCKKAVGHLEKISEELEACSYCTKLWRLGDELPKAFLFIRVDKDAHANNVLKDKYGYFDLPFSKVYIIRLPSADALEKVLEDFPENSAVFLKNSLEIPKELIKYRVIPFFISEFAAMNERGYIKNFDEMAENAEGVKKIAAVRMDVDDLGKIFSRGLPENKRTLSRVATMSRFLSYFFRCYIDLLLEKSDKELNRICEKEYLPKIAPKKNKREVVVVYSGGDDLFIVGAWHDVFEACFEIREAFRQFVGGNPHITISGGVAIFDPKYPLYRATEISKERLEKAKDESPLKDRIYLLEKHANSLPESYQWDEFMEIWNKYIPKIYDTDKRELKVNGRALRRSIIRKILESWQLYVRNPKDSKWIIPLVYHLSRHDLTDVFRDLLVIDINKQPHDIYFLDVPLRILDMIVRR